MSPLFLTKRGGGGGGEGVCVEEGGGHSDIPPGLFGLIFSSRQTHYASSNSRTVNAPVPGLGSSHTARVQQAAMLCLVCRDRCCVCHCCRLRTVRRARRDESGGCGGGGECCGCGISIPSAHSAKPATVPWERPLAGRSSWMLNMLRAI